MPVNAARHARKLKEIKKVQDAIRYRDNYLERTQPLRAKKWDMKQYLLNKVQSKAKSVNVNVKTARINAREDWDLGPLRPHRAVGENADTYDIYQREGMWDPQIPKHLYGSADEINGAWRRLLPENVLLNQWPIVEGDRVVIMRGIHKNKIGVVSDLLKDANMVSVKGLNMVYIDSDWLTLNETNEKKREMEKPFSFDDVRLVAVWKDADGTRRDVIVDKVRMERHTTGINPFTFQKTGVDPETGKPIITLDPETGEPVYQEPSIPEEQQVDPNTGEVLYHRYVGYGSNLQRIPWPWEVSESKEKEKPDELTEEQEKGFFKRTTGKVTSKVSSWRSRNKETEKPAKEEGKEEEADVEKRAQTPDALAPPIHPEEPAYDFDDDTSVNVVELPWGDLNQPGHFIPSMATGPLPASVIEELEHVRSEEEMQKLEDEELQQREAARELAAKEAPVPKTPRQVFAELHAAKKAAEQPRVIPFMGGLSRRQKQRLHQRFGLGLAEQFAQRVQKERNPGVGTGAVGADPKLLVQAIPKGSETLTQKNV